MTSAEPPSAEKAESFEWRVRLSDKAPWKRYVVLAAAVLAAVVGAGVYGRPLLGGLGFAIILGSTAEFWLGSSFKIDDTGATAKTGLSPTTLEWKDVKRVVIEDQGIKLSPLASEGRMDAFRGVYLRFAENNRVQVIDAVRKHVNEDVRLLDGRPN